MSFEVTEAFVNQYHANLILLSQQKTSRLEPYVRREKLTAEFSFYDRIGPVEAQRKGGRHSDTPLMSTPHSRRRVTGVPYNWADMVDKADRIRMLVDPTSPYAQNAIMGFNRTKDRIIIDAAFANAYAGKEGQITVPFPTSQTIAADSTGLTIDKLLEAKEMMDAAEVDDAMPRIAVITAKQVTNLLKTTEVKSADYNTIKALAKGEVDTFCGWKFIRTELLPKNGQVRDCLFFVSDGLLLGLSEDITVKVSERPDKNYSTQVYVEMDLGGTRMEEVKVIKVQCTEA
jgi:hypothetical protein